MSKANRTTKPERRHARRTRPTECRRHGVGRTARLIREGWGTIRFTRLDAAGRPCDPPYRFFGKIEAVYDR